jgi:hypothetical protein
MLLLFLYLTIDFIKINNTYFYMDINEYQIIEVSS